MFQAFPSKEIQSTWAWKQAPILSKTQRWNGHLYKADFVRLYVSSYLTILWLSPLLCLSFAHYISHQFLFEVHRVKTEVGSIAGSQVKVFSMTFVTQVIWVASSWWNLFQNQRPEDLMERRTAEYGPFENSDFI